MANDPLISVIVPMYNSEKYVAMCLESLLMQTLKDFEVIVIDDCSTDNSLAIVEDYVQKFEHGLKILKRAENSGYGSIPRNEGLEIARGKYIFFMDSDDLILEEAFENLSNIAEENQADIVVCKKRLSTFGEGEDFFKNMTLDDESEDTEIEILPADIPSRLQYYLNDKFPTAPWRKFIRRDFLIENNIKFLNIMQEDSVWNFELICLAKKILLTPHICYIYRKHPNSVCDKAYNQTLTPDSIYKKFDRVMHGLKYLDDFMSKFEFFNQNPEVKFIILHTIIDQNLTWIYTSYKDAKPFQIYENLKKAIKNETSDFDVLISLFTGFSFSLIKMIKKD